MALISLMISLAMKVAGRRLAAEDDGARHVVAMRVVLDAVVERDDMQRVEQLPLVLVDALDLAVEERVRVERDRLAPTLVLVL